MRADGGGGRDRIQGGPKGDLLTDGDRTGAADGDVIRGGRGLDRVSYRERKRPVRVYPGGGGASGERGERDRLRSIENVTGGAAGDRITLAPVEDPYYAEETTILGRGGPDVIRGNNAANMIVGGPGDDRIVGGGYNDVLQGRAGDDTLAGGEDMDLLTGGDGFDRIRCGAALDEVFLDGQDFMAADCDSGIATGRNEMTLLPHPFEVERRHALFLIQCVRTSGGDEPRPIRGTARIWTTRGGVPLGRGRLVAPDGHPCTPSGPTLDLRVRLTERGRELARRPRGVLATIWLRGSGFPDTGWSFRLRAGGR
jgi:hypothetical protein